MDQDKFSYKVICLTWIGGSYSLHISMKDARKYIEDNGLINPLSIMWAWATPEAYVLLKHNHQRLFRINEDFVQQQLEFDFMRQV